MNSLHYRLADDYGTLFHFVMDAIGRVITEDDLKEAYSYNRKPSSLHGYAPVHTARIVVRSLLPSLDG